MTMQLLQSESGPVRKQLMTAQEVNTNLLSDFAADLHHMCKDASLQTLQTDFYHQCPHNNMTGSCIYSVVVL